MGFYDEAELLRQGNLARQVAIPPEALQREGNYSFPTAQMQGPPNYFDHVGLCGMHTVRKVTEGATAPLSSLKQKPNEHFAGFSYGVHKAVGLHIHHHVDRTL